MKFALGLAIAAVASMRYAGAAEIPDSIRQAYLRGATSISLPSNPVTIPLSGTGWSGHYRSPYLQTYVNGHGPYTFLFDTGAVVTILSQRVAAASGVAVANRAPGHHTILRANEIRVGGVKMRDYYAVLADNDEDQVDGILGFNSFGTYALAFDFQARTLRIGSIPGAVPYAAWMPYTISQRLPLIDLQVAGQTLPTLIDTGDDAYAWEGTPSDLHGLPFAHAPTPAATVYNGETGATSTAITTVDAIMHLGQFAADRPVVGVNASLPVPDIGMAVIDQFAIEFDRVKRRVAFAPRFEGASFVVPGPYTCGAYLSFARPDPTVKEVLAGSAADKAGLRSGDAVVSIGGRPARGITYEEWDRMLVPGRGIALSWKSEGKIRSETLPVIEFR